MKETALEFEWSFNGEIWYKQIVYLPTCETMEEYLSILQENVGNNTQIRNLRYHCNLAFF